MCNEKKKWNEKSLPFPDENKQKKIIIIISRNELRRCVSNFKGTNIEKGKFSHKDKEKINYCFFVIANWSSYLCEPGMFCLQCQIYGSMKSSSLLG